MGTGIIVGCSLAIVVGLGPSKVAAQDEPFEVLIDEEEDLAADDFDDVEDVAHVEDFEEADEPDGETLYELDLAALRRSREPLRVMIAGHELGSDPAEIANGRMHVTSLRLLAIAEEDLTALSRAAAVE